MEEVSEVSRRLKFPTYKTADCDLNNRFTMPYSSFLLEARF